MFFEEVAQIPEIAKKNGTSVFVVPKEKAIKFPQAIFLQPEEKSVITIDQVRQTLARVGLKQEKDQFVVIRPADLLGTAAANAFLKSLEEPKNKIHFVLITDQPSKLLPTVLSRAAIYFLRKEKNLKVDIEAEEHKKKLAKRLMVAKGRDLVQVAEEIAKQKGQVRKEALEILGITIEMLYKSFLITGKKIFLKKIPKFLKAYEDIEKNGNVKLQIVGNLC